MALTAMTKLTPLLGLLPFVFYNSFVGLLQRLFCS
jgi:hypothetical protein